MMGSSQLDRRPDDIVEVRSRISNVFLVTLAIVAVPVTAANLYRITVTGWLPNYAVHLGLAVVLCLFALFRNRVPYSIRAGFIVTVFVLVGLGSYWQNGVLGSGWAFIALAPAIAAILFGTRVAVIILVVGILAGVAIGLHWLSAGKLPAVDPTVYAMKPSSWVVAILTQLFIAAGILAAIIMYNRGLFSALRDAKRHEEELSKSELRFRSLVENSPNAVSLKDVQGQYLLINEKFETLMRVRRENVIGKTVADIFEGAFAESGIEQDREIIERKQTAEVDELFDRGDRTFRLVTTRFPIFDSDGEVVSVAAVHSDLTDRMEAENKLRDSEERFRALVEYAPEAITMIDVDTGLYVDANPMAEVLHGLPRDALIGKLGPADLGPETQLDGRPSSEAAPDYLNRALAGEFPRFEWVHLTPDGQETLCEVSLARLPDPHRKLVRASISDITERKRAEQELARLNTELEQLVEERTAELGDAQAELVKSERLATLGQLTATVSHELRNPLGAMRTSMYLVEKKTGGRDDDVTRAIDRVNRNITRCDQIIDELLDYTRIVDLEIRSLGIDDWLTSVLDEQPVPEGVSVRPILGAPGLQVAADSDRLRRAVINIYENGCQALTGIGSREKPSGKKWLSVETLARNDRLEIVFSDNGPGIPDESREKVFEPLYSTKNFGVGLGLPTVHQIMEQHGGGVDLSRRRGGGARFALWLPLAREANGGDE
jgi:PAS domain S-box-containing protein